ANTIGSKSNDVEITRSVIVIKEEIERLREQVQNVE
ncbi:MAG: endoribonuclease YicC domain-containing protein, partial [Gaiellaceae bacterium]